MKKWLYRLIILLILIFIIYAEIKNIKLLAFIIYLSISLIFIISIIRHPEDWKSNKIDLYYTRNAICSNKDKEDNKSLPKSATMHYVPGTGCFRDDLGNYYNSTYAPTSAPVTIINNK